MSEWYVLFKKDSLVKSKNITLDINKEIIKFEHHKTNKYLGINETNGMNHIINKEKIKKRFLGE